MVIQQENVVHTKDHGTRCCCSIKAFGVDFFNRESYEYKYSLPRRVVKDMMDNQNSGDNSIRVGVDICATPLQLSREGDLFSHPICGNGYSSKEPVRPFTDST